MSIQRNVAQQNDDTLAEIKRAAMAAHSLPWLTKLLLTHGAPTDGVLARLSVIPEQEGDFYVGIWLSSDEQFWDFALTVERSSAQVLEVERFGNITETTTISAHLPGVGKSFGHVAKQLLREKTKP